MGYFAPCLVLEDRIPLMQQLSTARATGRMLCTNPSDTFNRITSSADQSLFSCYSPPYFHPARFTSHLPTSKTHPVSASKWLREGNSTKVTQTSRRQNTRLPRACLGRAVQQQNRARSSSTTAEMWEAKCSRKQERHRGAQHRHRRAGDTRKRTITSEHEFGF